MVEIARTPALAAIAGSSVLIALSGQIINAVYMLFVYRQLGFSPGVLGMLFALGSLASAFAAERVPERNEGLPAMFTGLLLAAAGSLVLALASGATLLVSPRSRSSRRSAISAT